MLERLRDSSGPLPVTHGPRVVAAPPGVGRPVRQSLVPAGVRPSSADLFDWLFSGALAHPSGGIAGWRERHTGRLSDEYPEISGYYLSAAVFADATDSAAVVGAADWLTERIENNASASRRVDGPAIYNFDQGIIAAGLIKYGVRTGNARAVAAGIRAASRLRDQVKDLGHLPPLDPTGGPHGRPATWSTVGRMHLAKTVQCLLLAAELGVAGMREAARRIIDYVTSEFSLASDGLRDDAGRVNLHATCYTLEGLWIWDAAEHRTTGLAAILHAAFGELLPHRLPSGGFPRLAATAASREQSDVHAQVVRLAALLGRASTVAPSIARLRGVASPTEHGWSVPYEPQSSEVHENAWATMFAAQALALVDGPPDLEWWELI